MPTVQATRITYEAFRARFVYDPQQDKLGEGGFGDVFHAYDTVRHHHVALKIAAVRVLGGRVFRLTDEVNAVLNVPLHANVAQYYERDGLFEWESATGSTEVAVMQYYPGGNLARFLNKQGSALSPAAQDGLLRGLLAGLGHLHRNGVVHRDLKPQNVLVVLPDGQAAQQVAPLITDFGISKVMGEAVGLSGASTSFTGGTLKYCAPEQLGADKVGPAADLWSFGIMAFELLSSGRHPYLDGLPMPTVSQVLDALAGFDPEKPLLQVPESYRPLLRACLQKNPAQRLADAQKGLELLGVAPNILISVPVTVPVQPPHHDTEPYRQPPTLPGVKAKGGSPESTTPPPTGTYTETVNGVSFTMVAIPGRAFTMGDLSGEGEDNEKQHSVTLSGYHLGATEVTQVLWLAVMGSNPSHFSGCAQCPVEQVSWEDVEEFIGKLNKLATSGHTYRLPTEAEWEYAAREGGEKVRFGNGSNEANPAQMNFDGSAAYKQPYSLVGVYRAMTTPVMIFSPNALGLYDMAGNVWEWCADWYGPYGGAATNPKGPNTGSLRVLRGGSWLNGPLHCRVASRHSYTPGYRNYSIGFRLASQ